MDGNIHLLKWKIISRKSMFFCLFSNINLNFLSLFWGRNLMTAFWMNENETKRYVTKKYWNIPLKPNPLLLNLELWHVRFHFYVYSNVFYKRQRPEQSYCKRWIEIFLFLHKGQSNHVEIKQMTLWSKKLSI